jgi:hypothetical protein
LGVGPSLRGCPTTEACEPCQALEAQSLTWPPMSKCGGWFPPDVSLSMEGVCSKIRRVAVRPCPDMINTRCRRLQSSIADSKVAGYYQAVLARESQIRRAEAACESGDGCCSQLLSSSSPAGCGCGGPKGFTGKNIQRGDGGVFSFDVDDEFLALALIRRPIRKRTWKAPSPPLGCGRQNRPLKTSSSMARICSSR